MIRARLAAVALALLAGAASAQTPDAAPPPWDLFAAEDDDGPLSAYARGLAAESVYVASDPWRGAYYQVVAQQSARLGAHADALAQWDAAMGRRRDSVGVLPDGAQVLDAVSFLAERARTEQVVMINEAHHDAATRLLTLHLLQPLYEQGYRYLAAETFTPGVAAASERGYPTAADGHYADEPVFGAIYREALRLGYTLVPYEVEDADRVEDDSLTVQQRRDLSQAQHLVERIFAVDPEAKVLVHAGFGHVEEQISSFYPMAVYFRELTGIDPLTVDQTVLAARSAPAFDHPLRRAAEASGWTGGAPALLADADRQPLAPVGGYVVDVQVLAPRTLRPALAIPGRRTETLDPPAACAASPCLVEVVTGEPDAVPLDRLVASTSGPVLISFAEGATAQVLDGATGDVLLTLPLPSDE